MRSLVLSMSIVGTAIVWPLTACAQVYSLPERTPRVTAASVGWQRGGEPLFYAGGLYYPSGPTEYFDGNLMTRTGTIDGVPVYENRTLEPWSVVYVPVGGNLLRPYERRREGSLVGTVGSRTPSFPIQRDGELSLRLAKIGDNITAGLEGVADSDTLELGRPVGTSGRAQWDWPRADVVPAQPPLGSLSTRTGATATPAPVIRSVPRRETTNAGAFIEFDGQRYYTSGKAVVHDPDRFTPSGEARGARVFREAKGQDRTIFVETVPGGSLAPYTRRGK
jgi:hypothetical protein